MELKHWGPIQIRALIAMFAFTDRKVNFALMLEAISRPSRLDVAYKVTHFHNTNVLSFQSTTRLGRGQLNFKFTGLVQA